MMSLNRYRLRHLARKNHWRAKLASTLLARPDRLLGVILLGNTFANVFASSIATLIMMQLFGEAGVIVGTVLLTIMILIFAETAPKTLAALYPERVAFPAVLPLNILLKVFYPFVITINAIANSLLRLFGVRIQRGQSEALSVDELRTVVTEAGGKMADSHHQMLLRLLDLSSVSVADAMVVRHEIYGIDIESKWDTIVKRLVHCGHSFVPLYREEINNVIGMINLRTVLEKKKKKKLDKKQLVELTDKAYFIPEGALLSRQLIHFQDQQKSVGLVVDEYGDVQGLLTLQDVLEEIVGEFSSGDADVTLLTQVQRDGSVLVDGSANLRDLNRQMKWSLPVDGPKTVSGMIIEYLQMIPTDEVCCRIGGYPMHVLEVDGNTIGLVQVWPQLVQPSAPEEREAT